LKRSAHAEVAQLKERVFALSNHKKRLVGVIVDWNLEKGFGWVKTQYDGRYFVHASHLPVAWAPKDVQPQLVGQTISFTVERDRDERIFADAIFVCHKDDEHLLAETKETAHGFEVDR
jgi:hypothetical protein